MGSRELQPTVGERDGTGRCPGGVLFVVESGRGEEARDEATLAHLWTDLPVSAGQLELLRAGVGSASWSERRGDEAQAREQWARVLVLCREQDLMTTPLADHVRDRLAALAE